MFLQTADIIYNFKIFGLGVGSWGKGLDSQLLGAEKKCSTPELLVIEALARIGKRSGVEEKVCNWGKVWSRRKSGIEKTNVKHKRGRESPKVGSPGKLGADATPIYLKCV